MWVGSSWRVDGHLSVSRAIGEALLVIYQKYQYLNYEMDARSALMILASSSGI